MSSQYESEEILRTLESSESKQEDILRTLESIESNQKEEIQLLKNLITGLIIIFSAVVAILIGVIAIAKVVKFGG